jgi:hypothetical protein
VGGDCGGGGKGKEGEEGEEVVGGEEEMFGAEEEAAGFFGGEKGEGHCGGTETAGKGRWWRTISEVRSWGWFSLGFVGRGCEEMR